MIRRPPRSNRTDTLFPYPTLFRSLTTVTDPAEAPAQVPVLDPAIAARLKRTADGLVPAIVQQHDTGEVLMLGWMADKALALTLDTGRATYWSRSRTEYWIKGETPGPRQSETHARLDCNRDTHPSKVAQEGPPSHPGDRTRFHHARLTPA